jgi:hypothetical protein
MANQYQNMWANSTIPCSVILVPDATHNNSVKQAVSGAIRPSGISVNSNRTRPDPDFSLTTQAQQIAAIAGEEVVVWVDGATGVDLVCNYPWLAGDLVMSDSNGYGIEVTAGNFYVARAQTPGTVGALCPVDIVIGKF